MSASIRGGCGLPSYQVITIQLFNHENVPCSWSMAEAARPRKKVLIQTQYPADQSPKKYAVFVCPIAGLFLFIRHYTTSPHSLCRCSQYGLDDLTLLYLATCIHISLLMLNRYSAFTVHWRGSMVHWGASIFIQSRVTICWKFFSCTHILSAILSAIFYGVFALHLN